MNERIKLTEEYWIETIEQLIATKYNTMGRDFTSEDEEKLEYLKVQIIQDQKIVDSVKMILETALDQRKRLIPLLTDTNSHRDISQKEFDRTCIIIDYLRPMWTYNTGKDIEELS